MSAKFSLVRVCLSVVAISYCLFSKNAAAQNFDNWESPKSGREKNLGIPLSDSLVVRIIQQNR